MKTKYVITLLIAAMSAAAAPSSRPAPTSQPDSFSVRGTVSGVDPSRVVVYLDADPTLDAIPASKEHATVGQKNKEFLPRFLAVAKGTEVEFPNWDHISHNVFSRSAAAPAFDLDRYPYGISKTREFTKVGIVQVFCNIHPQMRAMIFVTPNVFFTRLGKDGTFQLSNVPAGRYVLVAWQERCGAQRQRVEVGLGEDATVNFVLSENRSSIVANNPPSHEAGYGIERGLGIKREQLNLPVVQESHPALTSEPCVNCK